MNEQKQTELLVPECFIPPILYVIGDFRFVPLGPEHATADYNTWPKYADYIARTRGDDPGGWLYLGLTFEQNFRDLERHRREFDEMTAFAYAVFDRHTGELLGCVYLYRPGYWDKRSKRKTGTDWNFWTIERDGLYETVYTVTRNWLLRDWPWRKAKSIVCTNHAVPNVKD